MTEKELKPCPFCGSNEVRPVEEGDPFVWCKNTKCPIYDVEIPIEEWNARHD